MLIERKGDWGVTLKLKNVSVALGPDVVIGDVKIENPGEYDVAGVAVRGIQGAKQTLYVIDAEDMTICYVPKTPENIDQSATEQIGSVDAAIVPVNKETNATETIALVNSLDPNVVIPVGDGDMEAFAKLSNEATNGHLNIKLTPALIPQEGRATYILKS